MNWSNWKQHFEDNVHRPLPAMAAPALAPPQHGALVQSLAKFQLGESGEGRIAHEIDRATLSGIDDDYRAALKRFIQEEGRHARILGTMVVALGGRVLARQWTERVFVHARRLFGIRFKLLMLMAAEVIGIGFYGMLSAALPAGPMAAALRQICGDEEAHLLFHRDFFHSQRDTGVGRLLRALWWPMGSIAALTVLWDHRATLRAFRIPLRIAAARLWAQVAIAGRAAPPSGAVRFQASVSG